MRQPKSEQKNINYEKPTSNTPSEASEIVKLVNRKTGHFLVDKLIEKHGIVLAEPKLVDIEIKEDLLEFGLPIGLYNGDILKCISLSVDQIVVNERYVVNTKTNSLIAVLTHIDLDSRYLTLQTTSELSSYIELKFEQIAKIMLIGAIEREG